MELVLSPAVVIKKYSGCIRASPLPLVITSNKRRFGCVCNSSNITPCVLKPCLLATSAAEHLIVASRRQVHDPLLRREDLHPLRQRRAHGRPCPWQPRTRLRPADDRRRTRILRRALHCHRTLRAAQQQPRAQTFHSSLVFRCTLC